MASTSRDEILQTLRKTQRAPVALPDLNRDWIRYPDRLAQFAAGLEGVGGRAIVVADRQALAAELEQIPAYRDAQWVCSLVPGVPKANVDLNAVGDPHDLRDVDLFIAPGQFAVAENAAVWVTDRGVKHRAPFFLSQHLVLVVPAEQLVDNLHQAYERLSFAEPGFGLFISGPSKTADIEQSLVIGAHGARSLTVFLVERADYNVGY